MSTVVNKRAAALNSALSTPFFAPAPPKKRAPKPSKYSEESEAASDAAAKSGSPRLGNLRKVKSAPVREPAPWDPEKSPVMRQYDYTLTSKDLQPGMTVTQWNGASSHTIASKEKMTPDAMLLKHTDGTEAIVGRNASFAQGVPQQ